MMRRRSEEEKKLMRRNSERCRLLVAEQPKCNTNQDFLSFQEEEKILWC